MIRHNSTLAGKGTDDVADEMEMDISQSRGSSDIVLICLFESQ